jgi:hypothetical protein
MKQELSVVGIDLAKTVFHLVGMDEGGKIILRKRLMRGQVLSFMVKLTPCGRPLNSSCARRHQREIRQP